jgi:cytidine deaminase
MQPDWSALEAAARAALPRAYAPYSRFPVAAAVLFADGAVESGVNVENVSSPLGVCAERNAVAAGVLAGRGPIRAVLILTPTQAATPPCGGCRQVLREFGDPEVVVRSMTTQGALAEHTLGELLPQAFGAEALERGS